MLRLVQLLCLGKLLNDFLDNDAVVNASLARIDFDVEIAAEDR